MEERGEQIKLKYGDGCAGADDKNSQTQIRLSMEKGLNATKKVVEIGRK